METFQELLRRIISRFPTQLELAAAIGIDPTRLSRAVKKGDYPFNELNCLRLAKVSGESPSNILRTAGKAEIAGLIEELYGAPADNQLAADERDMLQWWRGLTPLAKGSIGSAVRELGKEVPAIAEALVFPAVAHPRLHERHAGAKPRRQHAPNTKRGRKSGSRQSKGTP